jgi:hypothetical protein
MLNVATRSKIYAGCLILYVLLSIVVLSDFYNECRILTYYAQYSYAESRCADVIIFIVEMVKSGMLSVIMLIVVMLFVIFLLNIVMLFVIFLLNIVMLCIIYAEYHIFMCHHNIVMLSAVMLSVVACLCNGYCNSAKFGNHFKHIQKMMPRHSPQQHSNMLSVVVASVMASFFVRV